MALLFVDSFDHYQDGGGGIAGDILKKWTSNLGLNGEHITIGGGRCGGNCLNIESSGRLIKGLTNTGTATKGFVGFAYNCNANLLGTGFLAARDVSGNRQWILWLNTDGSLSVLNGNNVAQATSSPDTIRLNGWYFVEIGWLSNASTGTATVKVNNVTVITATNIDTKGGASTTWTAFELAAGSNASNSYDDFYVCDDTDDGKSPATNTFLGDVRVEYLRPATAGAHSDWTVVGGGTHPNAVDKNYSSSLTTPSIQSQTVGNIDTNLYVAPSVSAGSVFGLQINILASKDVSGPRTIAPVWRDSGTDYIGTAVSPTQTSELYYSQMYQTNPGTGIRPTLAQVAADQYGVKVVS